MSSEQVSSAGANPIVLYVTGGVVGVIFLVVLWAFTYTWYVKWKEAKKRTTENPVPLSIEGQEGEELNR